MTRATGFQKLARMFGLFGLLLAANGAGAGALGEPYPIAPPGFAYGDCQMAANGDAIFTSAGYINGVWQVRRDHLDALKKPLPPVPPGQLDLNRVGGYAVAESVPDAENKLVHYVTVYGRDGDIRANRVRVNEIARQGFGDAVLAMNRNGNFVVNWISVTQTGLGTVADPYKRVYSLWVRLYDAFGQAQGPEVLVDQGAFLLPGKVLIDEASTVLAAYRINNGNGDRYELRARRIDSLGNPGAIIGVSAPTMAVGGVDMAFNSSGNAVLVWDGNDSSRTDAPAGIFARVFRGSGIIDPVIQVSPVSDITIGHKSGPAVAMLDDNGYQIIWWEAFNGVNGGRGVVKSRLVPDLAAAGMGPETLVASSTTKSQVWPKVCTDRNGNYSVVWRSEASGVPAELYARDFLADSYAPVTAFSGSQRFDKLANVAGSWTYYKVIVPDNASSLEIKLAPGTGSGGDANLYVSYAALPTLTQYDIRPNVSGNSETVFIANPPAGAFYIGVYGNVDYKGVSLLISVNGVAPPPAPIPKAAIISIINNLLLN